MRFQCCVGAAVDRLFDLEDGRELDPDRIEHREQGPAALDFYTETSTVYMKYTQ